MFLDLRLLLLRCIPPGRLQLLRKSRVRPLRRISRGRLLLNLDLDLLLLLPLHLRIKLQPQPLDLLLRLLDPHLPLWHVYHAHLSIDNQLPVLPTPMRQLSPPLKRLKSSLLYSLETPPNPPRKPLKSLPSPDYPPTPPSLIQVHSRVLVSIHF